MSIPMNPGANLRGAVDLSGLSSRQPAPQAAGSRPAPSGAAPDTVRVPSLVLEGNDQNFGQFIELSSRVPVVVDLYSVRSDVSVALSPVLERLVGQHDGHLVIVRVDIDANPQLVQGLQATTAPTVVVLIGGQPMPLFQGAVPEAQLADVLGRVIEAAAQSGVAGQVVVDGAADQPAPEPELPPLHQEAYDAIARRDYATAIAAYTKQIAQQPNDREAVAGLAQVSLLDRLDGKTVDAMRSAAAADATSVDAALDVADLDLSGGHVTDAFDRLLALFPTLDPDDRDRVRERILQYFEIVGVTDPLVVSARARLAGLLY
ncbi:tetratricopeptide repeat protein [Labedella endophytica]|uniref:Tetratricopeptide repeat protein n=1 Tax=Labedella endophytica TaxID=1523160 RepID=A0A433JP44_9MICO|nr:tetratricopeptide repeat protein [Labedella endophytica]RUQ97558.1 tetratricopeptide repeat protein [Labedella endophytica]